MIIFKSTFETSNFTFVAYGSSEEESLVIMKKVLAKHGRQYHIGPNWWKHFKDDIYTDEIEIGCGYRDHEKMTR